MQKVPTAVIDEKLEEFKLITETFEQKVDHPNEAETRLKAIDDILTAVLGWDKISDVHVEQYSEEGFVDYLLKIGGVSKFVVEAKKAGLDLVSIKEQQHRVYALSGSVLQEARDGIKQARGYASDQSVSLACLTNGRQWIIFRAVRLDGKPYLDGKAIIFPSNKSVIESFATFYELLSKEAVNSGVSEVHISEAEGMKVRAKAVSYAVEDTSKIPMLQSSPETREVTQIFDNFFERITSEDQEMMRECFVETKESKTADEDLKKITENLLNDIQTIDTIDSESLTRDVQSSLDSFDEKNVNIRGELILIVGQKGSGKSTFMDRFFNLTLPKALREKCSILSVNLAKSSGDESELHKWLNKELCSAAEKVLFKSGKPSFDKLKGMFFSEYNGLKDGLYQPIYKQNQSEFNKKFAEKIESETVSDPYRYLLRLLEFCLKNRKSLPCIVFDNTDQFPQETQGKIFQYAHAIREQLHVFIVCPVTDRTIWQLNKYGPLQSYRAKSYLLPVPPIKKVLEKRLKYAKKVTNTKKTTELTLKKGIKLKISDINHFLDMAENVLVEQDFVSRKIGSLTNFEVRRTLELARDIMISPHMLLEDFFEAYTTKTMHKLTAERLSKAYILGKYKFFNQKANSFVMNLFEVPVNYAISPLMLPSILQMLKDRCNELSDDEAQYVKVSEITDYFKPMGYDPFLIKEGLSALIERRLIAPYDPTSELIEDVLAVTITHAGYEHLNLSLTDHIYISHMALVTRLEGYAPIQQINEIRKLSGKMGRSEWSQITKAFMEFCLNKDLEYCSIPPHKNYEGQSNYREELKKSWVSQQNSPILKAVG